MNDRWKIASSAYHPIKNLETFSNEKLNIAWRSWDLFVERAVINALFKIKRGDKLNPKKFPFLKKRNSKILEFQIL